MSVAKLTLKEKKFPLQKKIYSMLRSQSRSRGAEIKFPPGAGAETKNFAAPASGSGSLLFIKDLKKFFRKKIMVAEEVFCKIVSSLILLGKTYIKQCKKVPVPEPEPKEVFSAP
jgi:hypothetical protein